MKNVKDRNVRIENIPENKLIYQSFSKKDFPLLLLFGIGLLLGLMRLHLYIILILLGLTYLLTTSSSRVVFQIYQDFIVYYVNEEFVTLIYYDEILNYRYLNDNQKEYLRILCHDESEYVFEVNDIKVINSLDEVIGAKRIG